MDNEIEKAVADASKAFDDLLAKEVPELETLRARLARVSPTGRDGYIVDNPVTPPSPSDEANGRDAEWSSKAVTATAHRTERECSMPFTLDELRRIGDGDTERAEQLVREAVKGIRRDLAMDIARLANVQLHGSWRSVHDAVRELNDDNDPTELTVLANDHVGGLLDGKTIQHVKRELGSYESFKVLTNGAPAIVIPTPCGLTLHTVTPPSLLWRETPGGGVSIVVKECSWLTASGWFSIAVLTGEPNDTWRHEPVTRRAKGAAGRWPA